MTLARRQVLVVDDDAATRFMISVYVASNRDLRLLGGVSLARAATCCLPGAPDAVVIDAETVARTLRAEDEGVQVDGLQVLMRLRQRWPSAVIFDYTHEIATADLALAVGADAVIAKATPPAVMTRLLPLAVRHYDAAPPLSGPE